MQYSSQSTNNKRLTEKEKNDFAIYLANLLPKEPELCQIIEAWPDLPEQVKETINKLVEKHTAG